MLQALHVISKKKKSKNHTIDFQWFHFSHRKTIRKLKTTCETNYVITNQNSKLSNQLSIRNG